MRELAGTNGNLEQNMQWLLGILTAVTPEAVGLDLVAGDEDVDIMVVVPSLLLLMLCNNNTPL
jgi:hypothetical protein